MISRGFAHSKFGFSTPRAHGWVRICLARLSSSADRLRILPFRERTAPGYIGFSGELLNFKVPIASF